MIERESADERHERKNAGQQVDQEKRRELEI
jgi:hypothetical protein